jgi:hypothetical protein
VSGRRGSFADRDGTPDPGENEEGQSDDPCAKAERSRKIMCDHDAHSDQNSREEQEHAHPVESSERQSAHPRGPSEPEKPVQVVEAYGHKKQHRKRQHKRDLHPQAIERIRSAHGRAAARQTQQHLRERKDEKSPDDDGQNRRFWSDPGAQRRGHQPNYGTDKLSPKAANVDRPNFALSVLDVGSWW